jgi:hypothetical protein
MSGCLCFKVKLLLSEGFDGGFEGCDFALGIGELLALQ